MKIKTLQFWYITLSLCVLRPTKSNMEKGILHFQPVNMLKAIQAWSRRNASKQQFGKK